jgi:hypothetical protein
MVRTGYNAGNAVIADSAVSRYHGHYDPMIFFNRKPEKD